MPRWWPGVVRMEGVQDDRFTQVFVTKKGRAVRVDFRLLASEPPWRRAWAQEIEGTPFERVLNESIVEVALEPEGDSTVVTIAQRQKLRGYSKTGGLLLRRATGGKLNEALDGISRAIGP
jgi:Polyketide cyclase / dehydrase and lipid transport